MKILINKVNLTCIDAEQPEIEVPCGTCSLCCKLTPYLLPEEIDSGLYPLSLIQPPSEMKAANPEIGPIIAMYKKRDGGCGMFIDGKCSIYEYRPKSCRQFDCRKGHHPSIPNMVDKK